MKHYSLIFFALIFISGCSSDKVACSDASNIDNPECQKEIPDITDRPVSLEIIFDDSVYFDKNSDEWETFIIRPPE